MKKKEATNKIKSHIKGISTVIIGYGVGEIIGAAVKDMEPSAKGIRKVLIKLGAIALTGMVIKAATDYVEGEIDEVFEFVEDVANEAKDKKLKAESDE